MGLSQRLKRNCVCSFAFWVRSPTDSYQFVFELELAATPVAAVWLRPSTPADSSKITHVGGVAEWAE